MSRLSRQHQIGPVAIDSTAVLAATGVQSEDLQTRLIDQIVHALHLPSRLSREELGQRIKAAVAALEEIKPRDGVEGMLGVQMVATHEQALECFRRGAEAEQDPCLQEMHLRQADRLMMAYGRQMDALTRYRGKGTPTVNVNYLKVEPGAQNCADAGHVQAVAVAGRAAVAPADLSLATHAVGTTELAAKPKLRRAAA
jgi:hypothetical protein